ncbi:hypothetical protein E3P99_02654 [Wallemia hederae]|uniref:Uncharacterized protein n=1 Tax=Wallemia hederae TaxID=1540922 RepID=A0A4T0FJL2_9BASI|nr:hypothetical protein E3P99_02654 [Wallemia hederae]
MSGAGNSNRKSNRQKLLTEIQDEEDKPVLKPSKLRLHQPGEFEIEDGGGRSRDGGSSNGKRRDAQSTPNRKGMRRQPHSMPAKNKVDWDMPVPAASTAQQRRNEPYNWQEVLQTLPNSGAASSNSSSTPKKQSQQHHGTFLGGQRSQSQSATKPRPTKQQQRPRTNSLNEGASSGLNWQQMQLTRNMHMNSNSNNNKSTTPSKSNASLRKNVQQAQHRQKSDSAIVMGDDSSAYNAYAGAAFHNSPAPNELPAPQFLK